MEGWVKLNVDAALFQPSGATSVDIIIRDSFGHALLSSWQLLRQCRSAFEAKAEACLVSIRIATEWVYIMTIIELECWELVSILQSSNKNRVL